MTATAIKIQRIAPYCTAYDAAHFEGKALPALLPRHEEYKKGELVIYLDTSRHSWRNHMFSGKVVRPDDAGITDAVEGQEYPLTLEDFGI